MVIWVNGAFGVGKTTAAELAVCRAAGARVFDPESVGQLLLANPADRAVDDFQDLEAWRALVPVVGARLARLTGQDLVVVQTVLRRSYWDELVEGFAAAGLPVRLVLLDVSRDVLCARIDGDADGAESRRWRLAHVDAYLAARGWLLDEADVVVDCGGLGPDDVAGRLVDELAG